MLRSDVERKHLFGAHETDRLPLLAYCSEVSEKVYAILNDKANRIVRAGHSVIVDAVFAKPSERAAVENVARGANVKFRGLFLTADFDIRVKRIIGRGRDASDADVKVARQQENIAVGALAWNTVDARGPPEQTFANARALLS